MRCVLIIPYFGKFKNYFDLFLKSCACNPDVDWLLLTDNTEDHPYPPNFQVHRMSLADFMALAQSKFEFAIRLDHPYKLCDFKPAYGLICEEMIRNYDYWGHCDTDLIFGNLSPLLTLMEKGYDKIFSAGHLTCYRNTPENNRIFLDEVKGAGQICRIAYTHPEVFVFDEVWYKYNVETLFKQRGAHIFGRDLSYNCSTEHKALCRKKYDENKKRWIEEKGRNDQLYWERGKVLRLTPGRDGSIFNEEFLYIHMQRRNMAFDPKLLSADVFQITADRFAEAAALPSTAAELKRRSKFYLDIPYYKHTVFRMKRKLKREYRPEWDTPWLYSPYSRK